MTDAERLWKLIEAGNIKLLAKALLEIREEKRGENQRRLVDTKARPIPQK